MKKQLVISLKNKKWYDYPRFKPPDVVQEFIIKTEQHETAITEIWNGREFINDDDIITMWRYK